MRQARMDACMVKCEEPKPGDSSDDPTSTGPDKGSSDIFDCLVHRP
jgi:hypothetical protein